MTFGKPHLHYETCKSTNDLAREWACDPRDPAPHGALVTADFQTHGRGRRGRTWIAPAGHSVLMSLVVHLGEGAKGEAWPLAFVAALAVSDALAPIAGPCLIKWPNDLLIGNGKAAGILVETFQAPGTKRWIAIVGIGVNINQESFPEGDGYLHPPISVRMATGQNHDRELLTRAIAEHFSTWENIWREANSVDKIIDACRNRLAVGCQLQRGGVSGQLVDLLSDGRARIRLAEGTLTTWDSVDGEEGINGV